MGLSLLRIVFFEPVTRRNFDFRREFINIGSASQLDVPDFLDFIGFQLSEGVWQSSLSNSYSNFR